MCEGFGEKINETGQNYSHELGSILFESFIQVRFFFGQSCVLEDCDEKTRN